MKLITSLSVLRSMRNIESAELQCELCKKTFLKSVKEIKLVLNNTRPHILKYCSKQCQYDAMKTLVVTECRQCKNKIDRRISDLKKFKHCFCSASCRASFYNNGKIISEKTRQNISKSVKNFYLLNPYKTLNRRKRKIKPKKILSKKINCSFCGNEFVSIRNKSCRYPSLCSDSCLINMKQLNARGNKKLIYKDIRFDSRWEIDVAIFLDSLYLRWERPITPVPWQGGDGKSHKYFPDFFLPDYDLYLDPKNPICISKQIEKLNIVSKKINLIYGEKEMIFNYIKNMVGKSGVKPDLRSS